MPAPLFTPRVHPPGRPKSAVPDHFHESCIIGVQIELALDDWNIKVSTNASLRAKVVHVDGGVAGGCPAKYDSGLSVAFQVFVIGAGVLPL